METLLAAKQGLSKELEKLISENSDVNFENPNYDSIDETRPKKSMYCAECYQRVKRKDRSNLRSLVFGSTFSCDWSSHLRSVVITDPDADICCCTTPSGDKCNWLICVDCFTKTTYGLKATHQMYGLQLGLSSLFMACELGDVATVEVLLGFNPDLSVRETGGATLLHAAASGGHVSIMRSLLDRGLSVSDVDKIGDTPLHWIPGHGSAASVRLLLDRGADVNAENSLHYTPILLATLRDNAAAATAMLNAGATTDINTVGWGTPLTASCLGNFHRVTEVLL
eukprot:gene19095-21720_t